MFSDTSKNKYYLLGILAYGLIVMSWNVNYSSASHDEALNIYMGRQVLAGFLGFSGSELPDSSLQYRLTNYLIPQHTGSVMVQPMLAAIGDHFCGLSGARSVGIFFGLGLTVIVYWITRTLFSDKHGLIAALLFLFSPTPLYLSKLATYDIVSVFFLALSFLLILLSERRVSVIRSCLWLFAGATALFLAAITKYVALVCVFPLIIYVLWRHSFFKALMFFLLPLAIYITLYGVLAIAPAWNGPLSGSSIGPYKEGRLDISVISERIYQWLAIPYLLAIFAFFHKDSNKTLCTTLILLSLPVLLLHLISGDGRSLNKNVIYAVIFTIPIAAFGVDQVGSLFSMDIPNPWVKPFFLTAILVVLWVFGIHGFKWLEKQFPDVRPVISFLTKEGSDNMTVAIDSRYGEPDLVYRYSLEHVFPGGRFFSMSYMDQSNREKLLTKNYPDFLIVDEFYNGKAPGDAASAYIRQGQFSVRNFDLPLSWGMQKVIVFKRIPLPLMNTTKVGCDKMP